MGSFTGWRAASENTIRGRLQSNFDFFNVTGFNKILLLIYDIAICTGRYLMGPVSLPASAGRQESSDFILA